MNLSEIALRKETLPTKIEELLPLRFIGEKAVRFYKDKVDLIDKLELSNEQRQATLADGQDAGKALLMIETKIGQLLPPAEEMQKLLGAKKKDLSSYKDIRVLPKGIDYNTAQRARKIAAHPQEVEEVLMEAEEEEDIPTKGAVLRKIAAKEEAERQKGKEEITRMELEGLPLQYYLKLQRILLILPSHPPKDMTEKTYQAIRAYAMIIIKRLEVFEYEPKTESTTSPGAGRITG